MAGERITKLRDMPPFSNTHVSVRPNAPEGQPFSPHFLGQPYVRHVGWSNVFPQWAQVPGSSKGRGRRRDFSLKAVATEHPPPRGDASAQEISMEMGEVRSVSARGKRMLMRRISSRTGPESTT